MLPLPLTPFEQYMWEDDRPDCPMTYSVALEISGSLQRDVLEDAYRQALARHPLLTSRIAHRWWSRPKWREAAFQPVFDWSESRGPLVHPGGAWIDLSREAGVRLFVRPSDCGHRVTAQFHHAACDGLGAVQFLGDCLAIYGQKTAAPGQDPPVLSTIDAGLLPLRGEVGGVLPSPRRSATEPGMLTRIGRFARRRVVPVAAAADINPTGSEVVPGFVGRALERAHWRALKDVAARHLVTVNDVCVAAMFAALASWNAARTQTRSGDRLRIAVPVSVRTPAHDHMPAANAVSYLFLSRDVESVTPTPEFLKSLHAEGQEKLLGGRPQVFLKALQRVFIVPGLFRLLARRRACLSTVVLANVGDVRRQFTAEFPLDNGRCVAGNVTLESLEGTPPLRPLTRAVVSLGNYAGRLLVNLRTDPACFGPRDSEALLDQFLAELKRWTEPVPTEATAA